MADRDQTMMTARVVDSLYTEAMLLADEARSYFDLIGRADRDALDPVAKIAFSCESLRVTTRLLHVIAWLLARKAEAAGELSAAGERPRLGRSPPSDTGTLALLPQVARAIVEASTDLYARVARIDRDLTEPRPADGARDLLRRIEGTL